LRQQQRMQGRASAWFTSSGCNSSTAAGLEYNCSSSSSSSSGDSSGSSSRGLLGCGAACEPGLQATAQTAQRQLGLNVSTNAAAAVAAAAAAVAAAAAEDARPHVSLVYKQRLKQPDGSWA
jgi:hypothetical protein